MNSTNKKYISVFLSSAILSSFAFFSPAFAESYSVVSVTPGADTDNVSVLEDILVTFNTEIDESLLTKENFSVTSEAEVPEYEIEKNGSGVEVKFNEALCYDTEYSLNIKNIAEKSVSFKTEDNPLTLLFEEDFSSAEALNKFTNTGKQSVGANVEGGAFKVGGHGAWNTGNGLGVYSIKGSEKWNDIIVTAEYKTEAWSSPILVFRQKGVDTTKEENQTLYGYFLTGGTYAAPASQGYSPNRIFLGWHNVGCNVDQGTEFSDPYTAGVGSGKWYGIKLTTKGNYQKAEHYDIGTGAILNSIERERTDFESGPVGFSAYYQATYYDNIKVFDNGFNFEVNNIKNTGDTISLIFNEDIDEASVSDDKVVVKKDGSIVDSEVEVVGDNMVNVKILDAEIDTVYEITVLKDIQSASDKTTMCSDKTFKIKTAEDGSALYPIELLKVTPEDGSENLDTYTDVSITFTSEPLRASIEENVIVTSENGEVPDRRIEIRGTTAYIRFLNELSAGATYNVEILPGIENHAGAKTNNGESVTFTTAKAEEDILFEADFSGCTTVPDTFIRKGTSHENNTYSIDGEALRIGGTGNWTVGNSPYAMICGSENWSDYKIIAEYRDRLYSAGVLAVRQQVDTSVETDPAVTNGYFVRSGQYEEKNGAMLEVYKDAGKLAASAEPTENADLVAFERTYRMEVEVIGSTIKAKTYDKVTGTLIQELEYTDSDNKYSKGAIGFGALWDFTYWDNIKVIDKGLSFKVSQKKNINGSFALEFSRKLDAESIDGNIIVTDKNGEKTATRITFDGENRVNVVIEEPVDENVYTVCVKKEISDTEGSCMSMDKSFDVTISLPYVVEELYISDESGKVDELSEGIVVNGVAKIKHRNSMDCTLVIIVYDETGAMYDIAFENKKLENDGTVMLKTDGITLPQSTDGYTASVFLIDSMKNISLLADSISI